MSGTRLFIPTAVDRCAIAARPAGCEIQDAGGATMGTRWSLRFACGQLSAADAAGVVQAACDAIVAEMSQWEPGSALSRFNAAPPGRWQTVPPHLLHVLAAALAVAEECDGAFDPTIGALATLWGFGPVPADVLPPARDAIGAARAQTGWRRLELDRFAQRVLQPGVQLDLSGIAKGHAVDLAADRLRAAGCGHFLLEIGGELRGEGVRPNGAPWWVDIESPPKMRVPPARIALHGLSIATSGDYRRFFEADGRWYAHSIDPRTGEPASNDIASVTVIHPSCMLADAYATALTILGEEDGMALAERLGLAVRLLSRVAPHPRERLSSALSAMLD